jgi:hypothetical protein
VHLNKRPNGAYIGILVLYSGKPVCSAIGFVLKVMGKSIYVHMHNMLVDSTVTKDFVVNPSQIGRIGLSKFCIFVPNFAAKICVGFANNL